MTGTAEANRSCTLCDVAKPDAPALRDHVLNVHPDEFCGIYHQQPCEHDRRERYMAALLDADPYALIERRDDRARFADAVMAVADAEVPIVLRMAADVIANHPGPHHDDLQPDAPGFWWDTRDRDAAAALLRRIAAALTGTAAASRTARGGQGNHEDELTPEETGERENSLLYWLGPRRDTHV
jgi:hypothetical protein